MDKPNRTNTIKIKLNGESKTFSEESVEKENSSTNEPYTKVIKIRPDLPDHEAYEETAAAQESAEESFDWIIPESSDYEIEEYKVVSTKKLNKGGQKKTPALSAFSNKRNGGVLKSILLTAVFAILIGTSFGVLMLKLVITDGTKPAVVEPVVADNGTGKNSGDAKGKTTNIALAAQTIFVVQGGAFKSVETAIEGANQASSNGAASQTLGIGDMQYVFLGVTDSIETAKQLGAYYKANGIEDAFHKQISVNEKTISDINETEKSFLEASSAVFQQLTKVATNAILTSSLSSESIKSVSALAEDINQDKSKMSNEKVKSLQAGLTGAIEKLRNYGESKNSKSLIEAQQHLLNYLSVYYSL